MCGFISYFASLKRLFYEKCSYFARKNDYFTKNVLILHAKTIIFKKILYISKKSSNFAAKVAKMMKNASASNIVNQIRQLGKKVLPKGSHLLLYGSRARGDNRIDSDWDLLVLLNRPQTEDADFATISYPLMELGFSLGQYFSVHTYSQQEWQDMSFLPFYKNVERDKIQIV